MTEQPDTKPAFAAQAAWRDRNKKAVWAQRALRSAIKQGVVQQQPCEVCGDPDSEGHHDDYDRPAVVRWLCRAHHKAEHARLRVEGRAA